MALFNFHNNGFKFQRRQTNVFFCKSSIMPCVCQSLVLRAGLDLRAGAFSVRHRKRSSMTPQRVDFHFMCQSIHTWQCLKTFSHPYYIVMKTYWCCVTFTSTHLFINFVLPPAKKNITKLDCEQLKCSQHPHCHRFSPTLM